MPAAFTSCVNSGGKVRTIDLGENKYMRICYPKGGGKGVPSEVKQKEAK